MTWQRTNGPFILPLTIHTICGTTPFVKQDEGVHLKGAYELAREDFDHSASANMPERDFSRGSVHRHEHVGCCPDGRHGNWNIWNRRYGNWNNGNWNHGNHRNWIRKLGER